MYFHFPYPCQHVDTIKRKHTFTEGREKKYHSVCGGITFIACLLSFNFGLVNKVLVNIWHVLIHIVRFWKFHPHGKSAAYSRHTYTYITRSFQFLHFFFKRCAPFLKKIVIYLAACCKHLELKLWSTLHQQMFV